MSTSRQRRKADALVQRADALQVQGRALESLADYEAALRLVPEHGGAHANLGLALLACQRPQEALGHLEGAALLLPHVATVHYNLGNAHRACGQDDEAERRWRRAIELQPAFAPVHVNLASLVLEGGREEEAVVLLHRALQVDPSCVPAFVNLGNLFLGRGRIQDAVLCYLRALELDPSQWVAHSNLIFALDLDEEATYADSLAERLRWNERHAAPLKSLILPYANPPRPERRLRVGYVSGEFRQHSAAYSILPVLSAHDHDSFEVTCYYVFAREDAITARFRACADRWRTVDGLSDEALADLIRSDAIDILVDLSGHSAGHRLRVFARKPAPVQVSAWGHATGTGLDAMDYLFSDDVVIPPEFESYHVEQVWRLPSALCFDPPLDAPPVGPLPLLAQGFVTYGCLNRFSKITPRVLVLWATLLREAPTARLLLKDPVFDSAGPRRDVAATFARLGVEESRLILLGRTSRRDHLDACNSFDVALDPFPHGGGITALECLWMGVPAVTLCGDRPGSRVNKALLRHVGLADEFSAVDEPGYLRKALERASDVDFLASLRANLRKRTQASPVCDSASYCRAVEDAYRAMWRRWCESQA